MRAGGQARGTCLLGVLGPGVCGRIPGRPYDRRRDCGAVPLATSDCGAPCTHGSQCQGEWHQLYHQRVRVPCGATYSYHLGYYLLLLATNIVWFRQMLWVRVGVRGEVPSFLPSSEMPAKNKNPTLRMWGRKSSLLIRKSSLIIRKTSFSYKKK